MKNITLFLLLLTLKTTAQSVEKITLEACYQGAQTAYPIARQKALIREANQLSTNTLQKNYLPQIELNAQASYQSDVTQFPIRLPNVEITPLSKDQYKMTLDVRQIIWDGGVIKLQKNVYQSGADVETQKVEVEINKLKDRVNQLYFTILQIDENVKLIDLLKSDLLSRIKKLEGAIANGTALRMTVQTLEAENLKADQRLIELKSARLASILMLNLLINKELDDKTVFEKPDISPSTLIGLQVNRPELTLFDLQKKQIDQQIAVKFLVNFPRIMAFATGGYGRPGFNFLKNEFAFYGIGGVTFKWNLTDFYSKTLKNDLQIFKINQQTLDIQRDIFLLNTNMAVKQQSEEIAKYQQLIEKDKQIVALRQKIKATTAVQLENGILTANDYLIELNAENQAQQNLVLHQLQLILAHINLKTTTGN